MRNIIGKSFPLLCSLSFLSAAQGYGMHGTEHLWNKERYRWEDYGIKINMDSDQVKEGDVIDFESRGQKNGKLEVFSITMIPDKGFLFLVGWDPINKINREFKFGYDKRLYDHQTVQLLNKKQRDWELKEKYPELKNDKQKEK